MRFTLLAGIALLTLVFVHPAKAQKNQTAEIKTSMVCGMCEKTIQEALYDLKGVKYVDFERKEQLAIVTYSTKKTDLDAIKQSISAVGYDADDVKADPEAQENLPMCCQPHLEVH